MKLYSFLFFLLFINFSVLAADEGQIDPSSIKQDCKDEIWEAKRDCKATMINCEQIGECLVRRDSCLEQKPGEFNFAPEGKAGCENLDQCMSRVNSDFGNSRRACIYKWDEERKTCTPDAEKWYMSDDVCPGDSGDWGTAILAGLRNSTDFDFTCKSVVALWEHKKETCMERIEAIQSKCPAEVQADLFAVHLAGIENTEQCIYQEDFHNHQPGKYQESDLRGPSSMRLLRIREKKPAGIQLDGRPFEVR